jgi:uncharacterized protein (DUF2252 family)
VLTDDDIEKCVDYLRDNAIKAASAKANRIYLEEFRKTIKAEIMRENEDESLGAQEAIAYADPRYREHLNVMKDAIQEDERFRWMMVAAEAKIEAWRTQSSNHRALGKLG